MISYIFANIGTGNNLVCECSGVSSYNKDRYWLTADSILKDRFNEISNKM